MGSHPDLSSSFLGRVPGGGVRPDQDSSSMLKLLRRLLALETAGETEESRGSEAARSGDSAPPDSAPTTPPLLLHQNVFQPQVEGVPQIPQVVTGKVQVQKGIRGWRLGLRMGNTLGRSPCCVKCCCAWPALLLNVQLLWLKAVRG